MNASENLDKVTINRLRIDMARQHATEYRALGVVRDQLLREVGSKFYGRFPKKAKVRR